MTLENSNVRIWSRKKDKIFFWIFDLGTKIKVFIWGFLGYFWLEKSKNIGALKIYSKRNQSAKIKGEFPQRMKTKVFKIKFIRYKFLLVSLKIRIFLFFISFLMVQTYYKGFKEKMAKTYLKRTKRVWRFLRIWRVFQGWSESHFPQRYKQSGNKLIILIGGLFQMYIRQSYPISK